MNKNKDCPFCGASAMQLSENPQVVAYAPIRGLICCSNRGCPMVAVNLKPEIWNNRPKEDELEMKIEGLYDDIAGDDL